MSQGGTWQTTPNTSTQTQQIPTNTSEQLLYQADWSNGLNGWNSTDEWYVSGGILKSRGVDGSYDVQPTLVVPYSVSSTNDYAVQAKLRIVSGDCVFLQLRGTPSDNGWNGYKGAVCSSDGIVRIQRNSDQLRTYSFNDSQNWHIYRVEVRGSSLRLLIDGSEVLSVEDTQFPTGSQVGLKTWNGQVEISSLEIIAL